MDTTNDDDLANYITPKNSPKPDCIQLSTDDEDTDEDTQDPILFIAERLSPQPKKKKVR